jgi:hypothetical protein
MKKNDKVVWNSDIQNMYVYKYDKLYVYIIHNIYKSEDGQTVYQILDELKREYFVREFELILV